MPALLEVHDNGIIRKQYSFPLFWIMKEFVTYKSLFEKKFMRWTLSEEKRILYASIIKLRVTTSLATQGDKHGGSSSKQNKEKG